MCVCLGAGLRIGTALIFIITEFYGNSFHVSFMFFQGCYFVSAITLNGEIVCYSVGILNIMFYVFSVL